MYVRSPLDPTRSALNPGNFRVFQDMYHRGTYRICELIPSIHHELGKRRVLSVTCGKTWKLQALSQQVLEYVSARQAAVIVHNPEHVPTADNDYVVLRKSMSRGLRKLNYRVRSFCPMVPENVNLDSTILHGIWFSLSFLWCWDCWWPRKDNTQ